MSNDDNLLDINRGKGSNRTKSITYSCLDNGCWKCTSHSHRKDDNRVRVSYKGKKEYLYRVVYDHYEGEIPKDKMVLHRCGNSYCINPKHLYLGTHDDNMRDMANHGSQKGEKNPGNINSEKDILKVRELISVGGYTTKDIAKIVGVGRSVVQDVANGKLWGWLGKVEDNRLKGHSYSEPTREKIKEDIKRGKQYKYIQEKYKVSAGFVHALKSELGELNGQGD